jgi:hypothetical protein
MRFPRVLIGDVDLFVLFVFAKLLHELVQSRRFVLNEVMSRANVRQSAIRQTLRVVNSVEIECK